MNKKYVPIDGDRHVVRADTRLAGQVAQLAASRMFNRRLVSLDPSGRKNLMVMSAPPVANFTVSSPTSP
jgi:hypothetical protein